MCVTCETELVKDACPNLECPSCPLYIEPDLEDDDDEIEGDDYEPNEDEFDGYGNLLNEDEDAND